MNGEHNDRGRRALIGCALLLLALGGWLLLSGEPPADRPPPRENGTPADPDPEPAPSRDEDRDEDPEGEAALEAAAAGKLCAPELLEGSWRIISIVGADGEPQDRTNSRPARVEFDLTSHVMVVDGLVRVPLGILSDGNLIVDDFAGHSLTLRPVLEGDRLVLTTVDWRSEDQDPPPKRIVLRRVEEGAVEDGDLGARAMRFYQDVIRRSFSHPSRGRVALGIDMALGLRLRKRLPRGFEQPLAFLTAHLFVLDREEDYQVRQLARIVLATHAEAVALLLERRAWRDLGLRGRREVAALLSIPGAATVGRLAVAIGDPADPVVLMALMEHTQHTFGCPSWYLAEEGLTVPTEVVAHWRRWLAEEWPAREKLGPTDRLRAEVAELQRLFDSEDALAEKECAARVSFLMGYRYRPPKGEAVDRDRLRKHLVVLTDMSDLRIGRPAMYSTE